jgi:hypothetical protein
VGERRRIQKRLERARRRFDRPNSEQDEKSLAKAAEYFRLDPKNPLGRERLLYKLADVVFGPDGKRGRPKGSATSWGNTLMGNRLVTLGRIYEKKKKQNPKLSDAKIAKLIKAEHDEFKNDDAEQIRQRLRKAHQYYESWELDRDYDDEPPEDWEPPEPDYDDD